MEFTEKQLDLMRKQLTKATMARKRLLEVAKALEDANLVEKKTYFGTPDVAAYIKESVNKLDFALDQLEIFMKEGK